MEITGEGKGCGKCSYLCVLEYMGMPQKNLMVIVCGSANSWIQDKLINNNGGLYNRVTYEMKLAPFNLNECEQLYKEYNVNMSCYDIVQSYMIFGGIINIIVHRKICN